MKFLLLLIGAALAVQWGMLLYLGATGWGLAAVIIGAVGLIVDAGCMTIAWIKL